VIFGVVTELPDLPEPMVDLVFPEPTVTPVLRALTAKQAQMALLVETALLERQVLTARPALKGPRVIRVELETAKLLAQERNCDQKARVCKHGAEHCEAGRLKFRICRHLLDNFRLASDRTDFSLE
jgi:hypothetical protein